MAHIDPAGHALNVLEHLRTAPFARVAVPRGRDLDGAIQELIDAAFSQDINAQRVELAAIGHVEALYQTLSEHIGNGQIAYSIDDLVSFGDWWQTRLFVLAGGSPDERIAADVLAEARWVADVTRDRSAPIRFLWAHGPDAVPLEPELPVRVWPADWRDIPLIETSGNLEMALYRAFRAYLDLRIYWESAGQKDIASQLSDRVLRMGLSHDSVDVDASVDQAFDSAPMDERDMRVASQCLADPTHRQIWAAALRQGCVVATEPRLAQQWNIAGLIWRPPGIARWQITAWCVRILLQEPGHPLRAFLESGALTQRLRQARSSSHIAQVALILSTQVEAELLDALRTQASWQSLLARCDLVAELEHTRDRASANSLAYQTGDWLLNYATFGQLVRLAASAGGQFLFPLSQDRLWEITAVRNHAAHGNAVRWDGIRVLVEALSAIAIRG
jgi:hypothetical protein